MKVVMEQAPPIPIGNYGTRYESKIQVRDETEILKGELRISAGGVEWRPAGIEVGYWLSWNDFAARMVGN